MCSIMGYCGKNADLEVFKSGFNKTISRGPDDSRIVDTGNGLLGFHRLAIMGLHPEGMQPFSLGGDYLVCNGEIYGFEEMKRKLADASLTSEKYSFISDSDCEILLPMYREYGTKMFAMLDAEFALILYDAKKREYIAARDPIGIRPLYYGYDDAGTIVFASEPKNLMGLAAHIMPFPPGHFYRNGEFICYRNMTVGHYLIVQSDDEGSLIEKGFIDEAQDCEEKEGKSARRECVRQISVDSMTQAALIDETCRNIKEKLVRGVEKRLVADAKVGFLLSGGLDSSLVCAIAARKSTEPIKTFAIGMREDAIDLKYAKQVADYIGSDHKEIIMTKEDVLGTLDELIYLLGTYDITTIRASMGMYLLCKAIHETTDLRVLLTGEISDELFGYKYTDFAPSAEAFQEESKKRIRELHMYDVLRADRCISVNSLEARVPFGDLDFVDYVMGVNPELKLNKYGKGKYLLRHAFEGEGYLPNEILWREKAAFSDAVGHSMVDDLKEYAEKVYTQEAFEVGCEKYDYARPFTKESLLYRDIFEKYYPGQARMIAGFWMPNQAWDGCQVDDPSARVLSNYGDSGK